MADMEEEVNNQGQEQEENQLVISDLSAGDAILMAVKLAGEQVEKQNNREVEKKLREDIVDYLANNHNDKGDVMIATSLFNLAVSILDEKLEGSLSNHPDIGIEKEGQDNE